MIKDVIFDFGSVLVDWNPLHLYEPYFGDRAKAEWFLTEICPYSWNTTVDGGKTIASATAERIALYPQWEKEIRMYFGQWIKMMGGEIPGMRDIIVSLKDQGFGVYGLTNWSRETFPLIRDKYDIFKLLDGYIVSGEENIMKPAPAFYNLLLSRYDLKAEECVFIDDNPVNVEGGEAVGIRSILFSNPERLKSNLPEILAGRPI